MTLFNPLPLICLNKANTDSVTLSNKDNAWHDVDMSAFVQPNSVIVLFVMLTEALSTQGVREKGSIVDSAVSMAQWSRLTWVVKVDENCIFEGWDGLASASNYQVVAEIRS